MITSKNMLREYLKYEKSLYFGDEKTALVKGFLLNSKNYRIWNFIKTLRHAEYHKNKKGGFLSQLLFAYYHRRKYSLGYVLGFEIPENCFEKGLRIYHYSSIVINEDARIGEDCTISGNLCIGNKGPGTKSPVIGSHVTLGYGAIIIGDIKIADKVTIGAGSVVTKSIPDVGAAVAGVPASIRKR